MVECASLGDQRNLYIFYSLVNGNFNISKILGNGIACIKDSFLFIEDIQILNEILNMVYTEFYRWRQ